MVPGAVLPKVRMPVIMGSMAGNQQFGPHPGSTVPSHIIKRKVVDGARINQRSHMQKMGAGGNCSLELKKVPRGLNDISHLNNHFVKFGKIVNIQVIFKNTLV